MIPGLVRFLLFQGGGEVVSHGLSLPIPGPVVGVVAYGPTLLANWAPVGVGLLMSVVATISVTALVLKLLGGKPQ